MLRAIFVVMAMVVVQAGPYAQGQGRGGSRPAAARRETTVRVMVRGADGSPIDGARVSLSGDASAEFTTAGAGMVIMPNLTDGIYRVRCEKDGYVAAEREFTTKAGTPSSIEVVMTSKPVAPPSPPPQAAPIAEPMPAGPAVSLVIADFVDRNFIGREPIKESVVACKPLETVRVLQMREAIAAHATRRRGRGIPAVYPGLGLPKRPMGGHEARPSIEPLLLSPYLTVLGGLTLPEARSFCHLPSTLISAVRRGAVVETLPTPTPPFLAL